MKTSVVTYVNLQETIPEHVPEFIDEIAFEDVIPDDDTEISLIEPQVVMAKIREKFNAFYMPENNAIMQQWFDVLTELQTQGVLVNINYR